MERSEILAAVAALEQLDDITIKATDFDYYVERVTDTEYRVSKMAVFICVKTAYFETVEDVVNFIY